MVRAPCDDRVLIVLRLLMSLELSETFPFKMGTFKSHLKRTFLPLKFILSMVLYLPIFNYSLIVETGSLDLASAFLYSTFAALAFFLSPRT